MSDSFDVHGLAGSADLSGTVSVEGAKNAALPLMAAAVLMEGDTQLSNVPNIADVLSMNQLLEGLGAYTSFDETEHTLSIRTQDARGAILDQDIAKRMRASVLLIGSVLARNGKVTFPHPGGCVLGSRPIDLFIQGFEALGATSSETPETYTLSAEKGLSGGEIFFKVVSVTATETFMMAAVKASSPVTLKNCAMEPEVVALAEFLKKCGARITGAGSPTIVIHPSHVEPPADPVAVIPDRIEAGSFLILGAMAGRKGTGITVENCAPDHLDALLSTLKEMGVPVTVKGTSITTERPENLKAVGVRTHEYPGFPTDLQAPLGVLMTQATGECSILEVIFDGRLNYALDLVRMGAEIEVWNPHKATIKGPTALKARDIDGPDIRAGLAFLLAAAVAEGRSKIGNAHLIDRGYEKIEAKLSELGLDVRRVEG